MVAIHITNPADRLGYYYSRATFKHVMENVPSMPSATDFFLRLTGERKRDSKRERELD